MAAQFQIYLDDDYTLRITANAVTGVITEEWADGHVNALDMDARVDPERSYTFKDVDTLSLWIFSFVEGLALEEAGNLSPASLKQCLSVIGDIALLWHNHGR